MSQITYKKWNPNTKYFHNLGGKDNFPKFES